MTTSWFCWNILILYSDFVLFSVILISHEYNSEFRNHQTYIFTNGALTPLRPPVQTRHPVIGPLASEYSSSVHIAPDALLPKILPPQVRSEMDAIFTLWCSYAKSKILVIKCTVLVKTVIHNAYVSPLGTAYISIRAAYRFAPSQWETSLQSNAVSHWLGVNLESALSIPEHTFSYHIWRWLDAAQ